MDNKPIKDISNPLDFIMSFKTKAERERLAREQDFSNVLNLSGNALLITISEKNTDPADLAIKYSVEDLPPYVWDTLTAEEIETERSRRIKKLEEDIESGNYKIIKSDITKPLTFAQRINTKEDKEKDLAYLKKSTTDGFATYLGYEFNSETKKYDKHGRHPDGHFYGFSLGSTIFLDRNGNMVNQAEKKDIDWDKMKQIISSKEKPEYVDACSSPTMFINQKGEWFGRTEFITDDQSAFYNEWKNALKDTKPTDLFTSWEVYID